MGGDCNCQWENRAFTPSMHTLCDHAVFLRYKRHLWQVLSTSTILNRQESGSSLCLIRGPSDQWRPRAVGPGRDSAGGPAGVPGTSVDELCFSVHAKQRSRSVHRSLLPSRGALLISMFGVRSCLDTICNAWGWSSCFFLWQAPLWTNRKLLHYLIRSHSTSVSKTTMKFCSPYYYVLYPNSWPSFIWSNRKAK